MEYTRDSCRRDDASREDLAANAMPFMPHGKNHRDRRHHLQLAVVETVSEGEPL